MKKNARINTDRLLIEKATGVAYRFFCSYETGTKASYGYWCGRENELTYCLVPNKAVNEDAGAASPERSLLKTADELRAEFDYITYEDFMAKHGRPELKAAMERSCNEAVVRHKEAKEKV